MKCQSWVDPAKFNKEGVPTPRSVIGTYALTPEHALEQFATSPKQQAKLRDAITRMVRCGGRVEFWMVAGFDEGGYTSSIDANLCCVNCGETVHALKIDSEIAEQWIQERLDATDQLST